MSIELCNSFEGCTTETLGSLIDEFEKLGFKKIYCHDTAPLSHNTIYIFSPIFNTKVFQSKIVHFNFPKKRIDLAPSQLWTKYGCASASLDVAEQHEPCENIVDTKTVEIIYTEEVIPEKLGVQYVGWYDPSNNILFLPDITHSFRTPKLQETTRERVKYVLEEIKSYQEKNSELFKKAQEEIEEVLVSFVMGADIEFEVYNESTFIGADRFFPSINEEIGRDGHRETGELRPKPDRDPLKLAANVKELLRKIHEDMPKGYRICVGGGATVPCGCHLHFSNIDHPDSLISSFATLLAEPILKHQGTVRNGYRTETTREQPYGWEYRPLMSVMLEPIMLESVFCVAYGLCKAYLLGLKIPRTAIMETYKKLPNWKIHKEQLTYFVKRFVESEREGMEGIDIRPKWFTSEPSDYGIKRYRYLDDDRMEWLYEALEHKKFTNLISNWILVCILDVHSGPDLITFGMPKTVVRDVAKNVEEITLAISTNKIHSHEIGFAVSVPVSKRAIIDRPYRKKVVDVCSKLIQATIDKYKSLKEEENKNPLECNTFKQVWGKEGLDRANYTGNQYELADRSHTTPVNLTELNDKDLAVLYSLYQEDPFMRQQIQDEINQRGKHVDIKVRGQYGG